MKYICVFNACYGNLQVQTEEMRSFMQSSNLLPENGHTILLCTKPPLPHEISMAPTVEVSLVLLQTYQPENTLAALEQILTESARDLLLFSGDISGKELAVRLGCRLNGSSSTGVIEISPSQKQVAATKNVYANNMQAKLLLTKTPACISINRGARTANVGTSLIHQVTHTWDFTHLTNNSYIVESLFVPEEETQDLNEAAFVVAAGRGVSSQSDTEQLAQMAKDMGAQLGASRPIAMNAWVPLDRLIGVSGAMLSPKLCITAGISGAGAFLAGVDNSQFLIAINTDPEAAIVKAADVAIIEDYKTIMPIVAQLIQQNRRT